MDDQENKDQNSLPGQQSTAGSNSDQPNSVTDFSMLSPEAQALANQYSEEFQLILETYGAEFIETNMPTFLGVLKKLDEVFGMYSDLKTRNAKETDDEASH
ncbi:unnamed protein product [Mesocestoides corti]|uniref:VP3 n=1 Tax=Mesocestoides corti TaxID=53468 RepID=A0A0R3UB94_MESCO|nr:unnamed protein product [Mesocestoides corti]